MNTSSLPHHERGMEAAHPLRVLEGPGESWLYGPGDGATRTAQGQPAGSSLPPALEAPSRVTTTTPSDAEAFEPGPSGPKGPILDTLTGSFRSAEGDYYPSPLGQRAFDIPGVPGQLALDGTVSALEPPEEVREVPRGEPTPDPRQAPLPLPEPWRDGGGQLRLDAAYLPPSSPVRMTLGEYQDALGATWASAADWMRAHHWDKRDIAYAERRAREVPTCGDTWRMPVCECGHHDQEHAVLIEGCDSRTCPRCGKLAAAKYRRAGFDYVKRHPVKRTKGKVSRGYALTTLTEPKPEVITLEGLAASVANVKKKGSRAWKKVLRFLPRRKNGHAGKYPGKCEDAGALVRVEVGPHGNVHAHVLRYGAWHYSEDIRWATGDNWTHDRRIRQDERGARGGVVEALKYVVKASTKPGRREFTHPALAVLVELATRGKRLVEGYGTMRGLVKQAEEAVLEERQGVVRDEEERLGELGPCPCCGKHAWEWKNVSNPRKRATAPPGS